MATHTKYQVKDGDSWQTCLRAEECTNGHAKKNGWLHYELRDGTNGLAKPGTWREKPQTEK